MPIWTFLGCIGKTSTEETVDNGYPRDRLGCPLCTDDRYE